jgi:ribose transport system substrate-binding protein
MTRKLTLARRIALGAGASLAAMALLAGCTGSGADEGDVVDQGTSSEENAAEGDTVTIGFSGPAADHGWLAAINSGAIAAAESFPDVELQAAEGTNDVTAQIAAVETFVNDGVDAIVLLPSDGAAMTEAAIAAMEAGIPVINVDREFSSPFAARATILGNNYGMGVSAGTYICEQLGDNPDAVVAEIAGIDALPHHDDDQGIGVLAAIEAAGRDEFFMVGGAGSKDAMELIQSDDSVLKATIIYPSTQAADGIALARLIAQGKTMSDLITPGVANRIVLDAPVVTKENVEDYIDLAFES